jgi:hypothetical protein
MTAFHDEVLRRGEFRGVARALEQGVELGREALLRVASVLLSEVEMAALRPLPLEGLEAAINERIAALKGGYGSAPMNWSATQSAREALLDAALRPWYQLMVRQ